MFVMLNTYSVILKTSEYSGVGEWSEVNKLAR